MRILFLIMFFVSSSSVWCQQVFTSPYTESWPNIFQSRIDEINRSISIGHSEIVIITKTAKAKEVETLQVEKVEEKNTTVIFYCLTRSGQPAKVIVPNKMEIELIDVFIPSEETGEQEHLRFYVYF